MADKQSDTFRKVILPIMAGLEAIATKGQSPGTAALSSMQILSEDEKRRSMEQREFEDMLRQEKKAALEEKVLGQRLETGEFESAERELDKKKRERLQQSLIGLADISELEKVAIEAGYGEQILEKRLISAKLPPPPAPKPKKPLSTTVVTALTRSAMGISSAERLLKKIDDVKFIDMISQKAGKITNPDIMSDVNRIVEAYARPLSGAAITESEMTSFRSQLFTPEYLLTPEGRDTIRRNLTELIQREKTGGRLLTNKENWYDEYYLKNKTGELPVEQPDMGF